MPQPQTEVASTPRRSNTTIPFNRYPMCQGLVHRSPLNSRCCRKTLIPVWDHRTVYHSKMSDLATFATRSMSCIIDLAAIFLLAPLSTFQTLFARYPGTIFITLPAGFRFGTCTERALQSRSHLFCSFVLIVRTLYLDALSSGLSTSLTPYIVHMFCANCNRNTAMSSYSFPPVSVPTTSAVLDEPWVNFMYR